MRRDVFLCNKIRPPREGDIEHCKSSPDVKRTGSDAEHRCARLQKLKDRMATTVLDVTGLRCPLPVLRANKAMRGLAVGDELQVLATDPAAPRDFASFCETAGHELVESRQEDGLFTVVLRKSR